LSIRSDLQWANYVIGYCPSHLNFKVELACTFPFHEHGIPAVKAYTKVCRVELALDCRPKQLGSVGNPN